MEILSKFYLKIFLKVRFSDIQLITLWQESYLMQIGYHEQLVRDPLDHLLEGISDANKKGDNCEAYFHIRRQQQQYESYHAQKQQQQ